MPSPYPHRRPPTPFLFQAFNVGPWESFYTKSDVKLGEGSFGDVWAAETLVKPPLAVALKHVAARHLATPYKCARGAARPRAHLRAVA